MAGFPQDFLPHPDEYELSEDYDLPAPGSAKYDAMLAAYRAAAVFDTEFEEALASNVRFHEAQDDFEQSTETAPAGRVNSQRNRNPEETGPTQGHMGHNQQPQMTAFAGGHAHPQQHAQVQGTMGLPQQPSAGPPAAVQQQQQVQQAQPAVPQQNAAVHAPRHNFPALRSTVAAGGQISGRQRRALHRRGQQDRYQDTVRNLFGQLASVAGISDAAAMRRVNVTCASKKACRTLAAQLGVTGINWHTYTWAAGPGTNGVPPPATAAPAVAGMTQAGPSTLFQAPLPVPAPVSAPLQQQQPLVPVAGTGMQPGGSLHDSPFAGVMMPHPASAPAHQPGVQASQEAPLPPSAATAAEKTTVDSASFDVNALPDELDFGLGELPLADNTANQANEHAAGPPSIPFAGGRSGPFPNVPGWNPSAPWGLGGERAYNPEHASDFGPLWFTGSIFGEED